MQTSIIGYGLLRSLFLSLRTVDLLRIECNRKMSCKHMYVTQTIDDNTLCKRKVRRAHNADGRQLSNQHFPMHNSDPGLEKTRRSSNHTQQNPTAKPNKNTKQTHSDPRFTTIRCRHFMLINYMSRRTY